MYKFTINVKTSSGGFIRVPIQAENQYQADQQARAMYGDKLLQGPYSPVRI
jgi:hypothetical protein